MNFKIQKISKDENDLYQIGSIVEVGRDKRLGVLLDYVMVGDDIWYKVKMEREPGKLEPIIEWDAGKRVLDFTAYWGNKNNFLPSMSISRESIKLVPLLSPLNFLQKKKISQQLNDKYYPIGQKGPEFGGNADQESEVAEELNEEMEAKDMENFTPGTDNLVIDKMDSNPTNTGTILAELEQLAILTKDGFAYDLIKATIRKMTSE